MESCVHCGNCAEACHFYAATGNPKYTPIWKIEPFKQAYKREISPFSFFIRTLNLKPRVTAAELQRQMHQLKSELAALDLSIAPLAREATELGNVQWGPLMRAGNDKSYLARQLERNADLTAYALRHNLLG